jgi:CHAD domain-containing protein
VVSEHRETERKYQADSAVLTLPPLEDLPQVGSVSGAEEETLDAEYYDTSDLRLIRSGLTLRRRRGGADEGWTLKLPVNGDSRDELWLPLGEQDSAIPAELTGLVRAFTRGEPLQPVAHITTVRRRTVLRDGAGASLAEVVADDVSAQSLGASTTISGWQEAEIELTGGDMRLLEAADRRLRSGGLRRAEHSAKLERALADRLPPPAPVTQPGPKSSSAAVLLAYLRDQSGVLKAYDPLVRRDEPDSVHQMRIAARRLRSTLQSFGAILPSPATRALRDELRWLGGVLGESRDAEVLAERLEELVHQTPVELVMGPVAARIQAHFAPLQAEARHGVLEALDSERYVTLLDALERLLNDPPLTAAAGRPAGEELPKAVARAYRRVHKRMRRAHQAPPGADLDVALHEARKAAKRVRYAAEALRPVASKQARRFGGLMKDLQSVLGEHQDAVITRQCLRDLAVRAALAGENAFAYGVMYEAEATRAGRLQDQAWQVWKEASDARYRLWLPGG